MLAVALFALACRPEASPPDSSPHAPTLPEPPPNLAQLDREVQRLYQERRATLEERLGYGAETSKSALNGAYLALGDWYFAFEYLESAAECYRAALALEEQASSHYLLGQVLRRLDRRDEAQRRFERVLELDGRDLPALVALGELAEESGDLVAARERYQAVLLVDPDHLRSLVGLARVLMAQEDWEPALSFLNRARALDFRIPEIHHLHELATARARGPSPDATPGAPASYHQRAIGMSDPYMARIRELQVGASSLVRQARQALQAGDSERAVELYQRAVAAAPERAALHLQFGTSLYRMQHYVAAAERLARAIELEPADPAAHLWLGKALAALGRPADALESLQRAVELDPELAEAQADLASVLSSLGRNAEAVGHFEEAVRLDPASPALRLQRVLVLAGLGRHEQALARLEQDRRAFPRHPRLALLEVHLCALAGDESKRRRTLALAGELVEQAATLPHLEAMAMALAATGGFEEAVRWQQWAVEQSRDHSLTLAYRDKLEAGLERYRGGGVADSVDWRFDPTAFTLIVGEPPGTPLHAP